MDISATRDKAYRKSVCGAGKSYVGNIFALSFLSKINNPSSNRRSSKYVDGKDIHTGPTEYHDISQGEIQQFATCKRQADLCSHGRAGF